MREYESEICGCGMLYSTRRLTSDYRYRRSVCHCLVIPQWKARVSGRVPGESGAESWYRKRHHSRPNQAALQFSFTFGASTTDSTATPVTPHGAFLNKAETKNKIARNKIIVIGGGLWQQSQRPASLPKSPLLTPPASFLTPPFTSPPLPDTPRLRVSPPEANTRFPSPVWFPVYQTQVSIPSQN
jgi:hypothetical protein